MAQQSMLCKSRLSFSDNGVSVPSMPHAEGLCQTHIADPVLAVLAGEVSESLQLCQQAVAINRHSVATLKQVPSAA